MVERTQLAVAAARSLRKRRCEPPQPHQPRRWLRVPDGSDDDDKAPRDDEEGPEESKDGGGEESK